MDGFETLSVFKAEPALSHIPLIFVTAVSDTESEMRALALGAADYIAKPFHMKIATRRIWNVIERERQRHSRPDSLRIETNSAAAAEARLAWRQEP
jgi:DNA-binding response OmpR family regulator